MARFTCPSLVPRATMMVLLFQPQLTHQHISQAGTYCQRLPPIALIVRQLANYVAVLDDRLRDVTMHLLTPDKNGGGGGPALRAA